MADSVSGYGFCLNPGLGNTHRPLAQEGVQDAAIERVLAGTGAFYNHGPLEPNAALSESNHQSRVLVPFLVLSLYDPASSRASRLK